MPLCTPSNSSCFWTAALSSFLCDTCLLGTPCCHGLAGTNVLPLSWKHSACTSEYHHEVGQTYHIRHTLACAYHAAAEFT